MRNITMPGNAILLLEGGSLRGLYTAGVLDTFMENDIYFPAVGGGSAGTLHAMNYGALPPGRAASINRRCRHDGRYFGPKAALRGGSLFGLNFMLHDVKKEVPFDEEAFANGGMRLIAVATNVKTGKPAYFEKGKTDFDFNEAARASASLPLASVPVMLDGQPYLDGGCSCPIALNWAQELRYNALMDQLDELEEAGRICCLRPHDPIDIGRFEGDTGKLLDLYNRGHRESREALDTLQAYLEKA